MKIQKLDMKELLQILNVADIWKFNTVLFELMLQSREEISKSSYSWITWQKRGTWNMFLTKYYNIFR